MNRRLRSSPSSSISQIEERLHRFLKPGDLARLRDTRISARSPRSVPVLLSCFSPPSSPSRPDVAAVAAARFDGFPCFVSRSGGPRLPHRKKLAAPKFVYFVPPSPDLSEPFLDGAAFGVDLVVAH